MAFYITNRTFVNSQKINEEITNNHTPSIAKLEELKLMIVRSKMLINNWVYLSSPPENEEKVALNRLTVSEYPKLKIEIETLVKQWQDSTKASLEPLFENIELLWSNHEIVKQTLNGLESYNDPFNQFTANSMVEDGGDIYLLTDEILTMLNVLIDQKKNTTEIITAEMIDSFQGVRMLIKNLGIGLTIAGIIIAFLTTRTIVSPVRKLRLILLDLSKGIFPKSWINTRGDEIGEMANALETVVAGLRSTKDFAIAVGSGGYNTEYTPLSDQDELGQSLLVMRKNLKEYSEEMEEKVRQRTAEVVRQKEEIEKQSEQIAELYEQVKDSILYAKRIQEAILPSREEINASLQNSMVLFRPKDIVSGDFYWFTEKEDRVIMIAADCTGHGVPGALMSMIGSSLLNEIVNEKGITQPNEILLALKHGVIKALNKHPSSDQTKDGMDIGVCSIPKKGNKIDFAGANNPLWMIRDGEIIDFRGDRQPVGIYGDNLDTPYTNHTIDIQDGDSVYIFTDGYADQFGGPSGKKFKYSQFKSLLLQINNETMENQRDILNTRIEEWMGDQEEQIDDILVVGIRF
ncbi:MAG: SpoIIE family protein phosphatase [Flavobacteriales bacterium]|nr:SpoIIE family protein phosphatase [Flavobacteriales bacterium]